MLITMVNGQNCEDLGKTWPQILAIALGSLAALTNGLHLAWTSPFIPKITKDKEHYDISEEEASYLTIIQPFAMILTCPFSSKLCDIIGRKRTLMLISLPQIINWILTAVATDIYTFYSSKVFSGIAGGIAFAALPMYIGEVSCPEVRGTWGNLFSSALYLGEFIMAILGSYFNVKETSYICISIPIVFIIFFSFMPESPYFYIMKKKHDYAKTSLRFFKRKVNIDHDFMLLQNDVIRQMSESAEWRDFIKIGSNKKALKAAIFLRTSQVFGGLTLFIVYIQFIFEKSGGNVSPELSSIIYTGLSFVLNIFVVIFVVDRLERKNAYICSIGPCSVILLLVSAYFYVAKYYPDSVVTSLKWVPITGMLSYMIFASFGMAVIPTLMLSELFSTNIKSKAMTIMSIIFGVLVCLNNYVFHGLYFSLGLYAPFLFLGCCNAISTVLSFFLIPETKGKTLEEIQQSLKNKNSNGVSRIV
ncbi:facilitated trehalose transporter Tret1 [Leptinotarsa decemlineata]|uniref:facilitated trehalose transporter Tret1 n=1 Tax=Leptinotarsa decemlineata TaxID=7539 RepID=UPI003D30D008